MNRNVLIFALTSLLIFNGYFSKAQHVWSDSLQIDTVDGSNVTLSYSPAGDLRVFLNMPDGATDRLYFTKRLFGTSTFGTYTEVVSRGREIDIHYVSEDTLIAGLSRGSNIQVRQSNNGGTNWSLIKSYPSSNTFWDDFNPVSIIKENNEMRLFYGYQYDNGIFGGQTELWKAITTGGTWDANGSKMTNALTTNGLFENGDTVLMTSSGGSYYSDDDGANYTLTNVSISDADKDSSNRINCVRSFTYGVSPDKYLIFKYTDDYGKTWSVEDTLLNRDQPIGEAHLAVNGNNIVIVWRTNNTVNYKYTYIESIISRNGGASWSPVDTIVTLYGSQELLMDQSGALDLENYGNLFTLAYQTSSSKHVYIKEIDLNCLNTSSTISPTACKSYSVPSGNKTYTIGGIYTDTIPNMEGCDSIITINLTINTADTSVTHAGNTLTSNATATAYQWIDCNNSNLPVSGETNQTYIATSNGSYAVVVTENGCTDTSTCYVVTTTGILDNNSLLMLQAYPNPTTGKLIIDLGRFYEEVQVKVSDISGKVEYKKVAGKTKTVVIDIDGRKGMYFVNILTEDGHITALKVLKH